jgi:glycosyltransferase involved in cell wall biosynthesis
MRVAIVKADWGIRGGFEIVLDTVRDHLLRAGHRVDLLEVPAFFPTNRLYGVDVPHAQWEEAREFFTYIARYEAFQRLDVRRADLVISTQPPSFALDHPRHMSLFYHHERRFYDLSEYFVRGALADPTLHSAVVSAVHRLDGDAMNGVGYVLAGSETIERRLRATGQVSCSMSVFHAGPSVQRSTSEALASAPDISGPVLCVSRHDFPKRTELFVHAAHLLPEVPWLSVGVGGRLGRLQAMSERMSSNCAVEIADTDLWLCAPEYVSPKPCPITSGSLTFAGSVDDDELDRLYRSSFCVVAPALLEDYGLTVIEAMQYGRPVIVCRDGGHLTEFIVDGVNGLVVEATGLAIAEGVRRLRSDPDLATALGRAGRITFEQFSWSRGFAELDAAIQEFV